MPIEYQRVKAKLPSGWSEVDPTEDITIAGDLKGLALSREMARQASLFGFYAWIAEEAYHEAKNIKYLLHCKREDLDAKIRRLAQESGEKLTEKAIEFRINRHPKMRNLYEQYMATRRRAGLLNAYKEAFRQKGDMLRSIGVNNRNEYDTTEMNTLKEKAHEVLKKHHAAHKGE